MIPIWYTIVFSIGFILFLLVLVHVTTKLYPNFSIFRDTISEVQDTSTASSRWINPAFFVLALILIPFPFYVYSALPWTYLSYLGCIILFSNSVGMFIIAIWPNFVNPMHYIGAGFGLGGTLLSFLVLLVPIFQSVIINKGVFIIMIIALFLCIPLIYSNLKNGPRRILKFNPNFWEWILFFTLQLWFVVMFLNLAFT